MRNENVFPRLPDLQISGILFNGNISMMPIDSKKIHVFVNQ